LGGDFGNKAPKEQPKEEKQSTRSQPQAQEPFQKKPNKKGFMVRFLPDEHLRSENYFKNDAPPNSRPMTIHEVEEY
jgi:hypothetical protein